MTVALLGRNVPDSIGFNFRSYLRKQYQNLQSRDSESGLTTVSTYSGVTYGGKDDDRVPPCSNVTVQFGEDSPNEI